MQKGIRAGVICCHGVVVDRAAAKKIHERVVEMALAAGCAEEDFHEDGSVHGELLSEQLHGKLGDCWGGASMFGHGAAAGRHCTAWFGQRRADKEVELYAVGFEVSVAEVNRPSKYLAAKWELTFAPLLAELSLRSEPSWAVVPQLI